MDKFYLDSLVPGDTYVIRDIGKESGFWVYKDHLIGREVKFLHHLPPHWGLDDRASLFVQFLETPPLWIPTAVGHPSFHAKWIGNATNIKGEPATCINNLLLEPLRVETTEYDEFDQSDD